MTVEGQGDETISWCEGAMSLHDGPRDARMREREENGEWYEIYTKVPAAVTHWDSEGLLCRADIPMDTHKSLLESR